MEKMTTQERNEHLEKYSFFNKALNDLLNSNSNKEIKDTLMEFAIKCCTIETKRVCSNILTDIYNRLDEIHNLENDIRKEKINELEYIQNKVIEERKAGEN